MTTPRKPKFLEPNTSNIPKEIIDLPQFVCWKAVWVNDSNRWTKPPINPHTGKLADPTDPQTWGSIASAREYYLDHPELDGIGFVFKEDGGITGIDFDHCINGTGTVDPDVLKMVKEIGSYEEVSVSGTGVHTLFKADLDLGPGRKVKPDFPKKGMKAECYDKDRFFTFTGSRLNGSPSEIRDAQKPASRIHTSIFGPSTPSVDVSLPVQIQPQGVSVDDETVLKKIRSSEKYGSLFHGDISRYGNDDSRADLALCSVLAEWTDGNKEQIDRLFRQSNLYRSKWDSKRGSSTYGEKTIDKAFKKRPMDFSDEIRPIDSAECFLEVLADSDIDSGDTYEWFIDKLVPKGEPMIIGGKGSSGKSTLALEFAARLMESDPEAGVVYICAEGTYRDTKIKARQMGLAQLNRFFFLKRKSGGTSFKLSEKEDLPLVVKTLERAKAEGRKITFVVIDSIRGMYRGSMSDDLVGEAMQAINAEICGRLGSTVCYIHHSKKNTKDGEYMDLFLGSVSIVNAIRHALLMVKKTNRLREIVVAKSNLGVIENTCFNTELTPECRVNLTFGGIEGDFTDDQNNQTQIDLAEEIILAMLKPGETVPAQDIFDAGKKQGVSEKAMKTVKKLRKIISIRKEGHWAWHLPQPDFLD